MRKCLSLCILKIFKKKVRLTMVHIDLYILYEWSEQIYRVGALIVIGCSAIIKNRLRDNKRTICSYVFVEN